MPLPEVSAGGLSGLLEILAARGGQDGLAELADELSFEIDDLLPLVDAAVLLGLARVPGAQLEITDQGREFAEADIDASKKLFGELIAERAPLIKAILRALHATNDGTLREGFFLDLLRRGFSADEARRQLDIAIDWGRYGELFEYDAESGELVLGSDPEKVGHGSGPWGRPRLGVSSCLLGEEVRFNGGHKRYRFLTDSLDPYVDWVPYCPEMEIGLGTPREAIRLTAAGRLVNRSGTADHTAAMAALPLPADLDGYVFKAKSPSCGIRAIPRYRDDGRVTTGGPPTGPRPLRVAGAGAVPAAGGRGRGPPERPGAAGGVHRADLRRGPAACLSWTGRGRPGTWSPSTPGTSCSCWRTTRRATGRRAGWWPRRARAARADRRRRTGICSWPRWRTRRPAAATPMRCSTRTAGSAGSSTGRGGPTWWPGSRLTGAARSRSACRSRCSPTTPRGLPWLAEQTYLRPFPAELAAAALHLRSALAHQSGYGGGLGSDYAGPAGRLRRRPDGR